MDTAYTATDGNYTIQLETGIYNVAYTKDGYFSESLTDQSFYANTTISSLTLLEHTTLINVPSLFSTIQTAINYAFNGDTVLVQPGTYVENINYNGKNIVVGSLYLTTEDTSYISSTIIDGNQNGNVIKFDNGEDATTLLTGFVIQNGYAFGSNPEFNGGGIFMNYSSPTLMYLRINNNSANNGGGIYCYNSSPTMTHVTMSGNTASTGGGIYCYGSYPTMTHVTMSGNTASAGGGIYCYYSSPTMTHVTMSGNTASTGGGIYCYSHSSPTMTHVTMSGNMASTGGGIYCYNSSSPAITNSIISFNTGNYGIYVQTGYPTITYSDFYTNETGNFYTNENVGDYIGVNVTTNANGDSVDAYNNIQLDPLFVDAANGDYNLQQGSPCIDAGDPTSPYDPDGSIADMGALPSAYGTPVPIVINIPTDYSTIQAGLTAAGTNDTVLVQPGTYTENIIWPETNGIKLISAGDSSNTVIDGGGVSSVIHMNPQTATIDTTTLIQGLKITNGGNGMHGGGMLIQNASPKLNELSVINNSVTDGNGSGIYLSSSSLILQHSSISQNITNFVNGGIEGGGGIYLEYSSAIFRSVNVTNNYTPSNGGGILAFYDTSTFNNVIISGNTSAASAGIFFDRSSSIFNDGIISHNSSESQAGGIQIYNGSPHITNTIIYKNTSVSTGGGIVVGGGSANPIFENLYIVNNKSTDNNGGGIQSSGNGTYSNITIAYNYSYVNGGAIHISDWNNIPLIENLTVFNNTDGEHNTVYAHGIYDGSGLLSVSNSNFIGNEQSFYNPNNLNISQALNNYWGHSSGPYHPTQNPTGQGDSVNVFVNVNPWLTTPNTDAPPIPAQNTTVTGTGNDFISLKWDTSLLGDLAGYKLYYDSDSSGYPYANSVDVGTDTSYTLSSLTLGTAYYLAVTTYDTDGNESWYSNEVTGVTRIMQAQSLDIGGDEDLQHMVNHTPSITFGYYDSMNEAQTNYQVQVSTDSTFSSANMWDVGSVSSDTTSVTYAGTALVDGTTYFLRVRVASGDFWSDWSTLSFRMNTEPTTPVLVSPINNQVSGTPVGLKVLNATDAEGDAITYSFNVYSDGTLTTKLDSVTAVAEGTDTTSWQVTGSLPDNGQYFWTVYTNDGYEESAVSDAGSFLLNTDNNAPEAFTLSMPSVNTEVQNLSPVFSWHPAHDPDPIDTVYYKLMLDTPDPGVVVYEVGTDTSFQVTNALMDNTEYFWQVMAEDVIGFQTINEGGYQTFYTNVSNDPPSASTLVAPLNGSIQTDLTPNFYWTEAVDPDPLDHVSYTMRWWGTGDMGIQSIDTDSNGVTPETILMDNSVWEWMVIANDMYDSQSTSDTSYFYSDAFPEPPLNFATVAPENNVEGLGTEVEFIWEETDDPDPVEEISYRVVYASDWEDSSTYVYSETIEDTSMVITLADNSQYYWLVEALDSDGFIVGSNNNTSNVIVVGTLAIDGDLIPVEFALRQNYPNPFNPVTTLRYDLPENGHVNIIIYDMLGREVKTLINLTQDAGYRSVIWDATNDYGKPVSAGIYLYQIQAGEYISTKKMVLLK